MRMLIPASSEDPPPRPSLVNIARPKSGKKLAQLERKRSFAAKMLAACFG